MNRDNVRNMFNPKITSAKKNSEYSPIMLVENGINDIDAKKNMFIQRYTRFKLFILMNS